MKHRHIPVLTSEVLDAIPSHAKILIDGTLGHGGHALAMIQKQSQVATNGIFIGIDKDNEMLQQSRRMIIQEKTSNTWNYYFVFQSYKTLPNILQNMQLQADFILLDIGVNNQHFSQSSRGFSIKHDGPLDMRFDREQPLTAYKWIMKTDKWSMSKIFENYADFSSKYAYHVANTITDLRKKYDWQSTQEFSNFLRAELACSTKQIAVLFQAIRISVNNELNDLEIFLEKFFPCLSIGGRCAIISYHSGEDSLVKNAFKLLSLEKSATIITKKPIRPSKKEIQINKASSSAKMRIIERKYP